MKQLLLSILVLVLCVLGLSNVAQADREAPQPPIEDGLIPAGTTFLTIDISIDPDGQPLGAFQFELTSDNASFTVVGVEAGEHVAFDHGRPPYFDPVAHQDGTDRLVIAEYAKPELKADQLPTQAVRVATVHVMFSGPLQEHENPTIQLNLTAAGDADGERIDAKASYSFRTPERPE
jgi:hypothetical protein